MQIGEKTGMLEGRMDVVCKKWMWKAKEQWIRGGTRRVDAGSYGAT